MNYSKESAQGIVSVLQSWNIVDESSEVLFSAFAIHQEFSLSFWDSLIIAAAQYSGVDEIVSEDLQHGQNFEGLVIRNPFV